MGVRGQVSVELLVVMAAFFAFLVAWLPVVLNVGSAASADVAARYAQLAATDIQKSAEEVALLGPGNSKQLEIVLQADTEFGFESEAIRLVYSDDSGRRVVERPSSRSIEFEFAELQKGRHSLLIESAGNEVRVRKA